MPDVAEALARAEQFGCEIIKPLGEAETAQMGMPEDVVQGKGKWDEVHEGYKHVFRQLAFVRDPDVSSYPRKRERERGKMVVRDIGLTFYNAGVLG